MTRSTAAVRLLSGDREPVRLASTGNLALAGLLTVDGVVTVAGNRVLAKDQTDATENGIYTASEGTWQRAPDANTPRTITKGVNTYVQAGTVNAGKVFIAGTVSPVLGTDAITFSEGPSVAAFDEAVAAAEAFAEAAQSVSDAFARVSTLAGLKALDTTLVTTAYLKLEGSEGIFNWRTGNYAARVTADPSSRTYVKADAIATTAGAWVRAGGVGSTDLSQYGAVGDGVTDNLAAINTAIADAGYRGVLEIPKDASGGVYYCSAVPTNPNGVIFHGAGYIALPGVSSSQYRWDLRGNDYPEIEGREYLGAFQHVCRADFASRAGIKIDWLGDSTMIYNTPTYALPDLVKDSMTVYGMVGPVFTNRGVSGATTEDIRTGQLPATITNAPHLVVIRPGHNDIYSRLSPTGGQRTDAEVLAAAELVRVSLDTMLSDLRAASPETRLSIVLMTPNTATLIDGRAERYYETLSPMYRALARKYQCCFVDTYRIWRDARGMTTATDYAPWLDEPYGVGNGGIHPSVDFDIQIADVVTELIYPPMLRRVIAAPPSATVTYSNGWAAYLTSRVRTYRRGQIVSFEGLIAPGTMTASTIMLSINANHAPGTSRFFALATSVADKCATVNLGTTGNLIVQSIPTGATWVSLDNISYAIVD